MLAVAAVDESRPPKRLEAIDIEFEHLPFAVDPFDTSSARRSQSTSRRQYLD